MDLMGLIAPFALCLGVICAAALVYALGVSIKTALQNRKNNK